jgi:hypothetical protein
VSWSKDVGSADGVLVHNLRPFDERSARVVAMIKLILKLRSTCRAATCPCDAADKRKETVL